MTTETEFDQWAASYDESIAITEGFPFEGYENVLDTVFQLANATQQMRVLDIGCGTGNLTGRFIDRCELVSVDFSAEMLQKAAAKYPAATFHKVDLLGEWPSHLPQQFDRIVSGYVLHEFDLPTKLSILKKLSALLTDDGYFVIGDIMFDSVEALDAGRIRWADSWDEEDFWVIDELKAALTQAGFEATFRIMSVCAGIVTIRYRTG